MLSLVIALFLTVIIIRLRRHNIKRSHDLLIVLYFWLSVIINTLSFAITIRSHALSRSLFFLRDPFHLIGLLFLLQFAYRFPVASPKHTRERRLVFTLLGFEVLFQILVVFDQLGLLPRIDLPAYISRSDVVSGLIIVWILFVFVRQRIESAGLPGPWWRTLWRLPEKEARHAQYFAIVAAIYFSLSLFQSARLAHIISDQTFDLSVTNLMLIALLLMATIYLDSVPGTTSFMAKLVGISMFTSYSIIAAAGWLMQPSIVSSAGSISTFQAARTLQFQPQPQGGYRVDSVPFHFETDLGTRLALEDESSQEVRPGFAFPFYGITYDHLHVSDNGFVTFRDDAGWLDHYALNGSVPKIIVFLMELDPQTAAPGGVYVRSTPETLVITWNQLAMKNGQRLTFQLALHASGQFELSFEKLPLTVASLLEIPALNSVTGIVNGSQISGLRLANLETDLPQTVAAGAGLVDDTYFSLRQNAHNLLLPLVSLLLIASLVNFLIFPLFAWITVIRPLDVFLAGVRRVNDGDLTVDIPIQTQDEIGFLTHSFNAMLSQLRQMVNTLELRVSERTRELAEANQQLLEENRQREAAQETNLQQQRLLAMLDERERLGRDLHDGLGQTMGYLNLKTQAAREFLDKGQIERVQTSLEQMSKLAQSAHQEVRGFIMGLRSSQDTKNLQETLELYLQQLHDNHNIQTSLSLPNESLPELPAQVEEQMLRVIQEALTNARKHAQAKKVEIIFSYSPERLQIIILDDGLGFDPEQARRRASEGHYGLEIMRERTRLVGGSLEIRSHLGAGTRVLLEFPLQLAHSGAEDESEISTARQLRLLLVDDSPLFLDGLRSLLMARGFTVAGEAHDGLEAQEKARELRPDVIVMDVNMPNMNGLEASRAIKAELPEIKVLILTTVDDEDSLYEAIQSGAEGYLLKNLNSDDFVRQLIALSRGETPLTSGLALRLMQKFGQMDPAMSQSASQTEPLSKRQWLILERVSRGFKYKEIALELSVSEITVKREMGELLKVLNMENRREALKYARQVPGLHSKTQPRP